MRYDNQEHAFKQIQGLLKTDALPSVILLCGKEQFLVNWARSVIIDKYIEKTTKVLDLTTVEEDELQDVQISDLIIEACETYPVLSQKKIVVVENTDLLASKDTGYAKANISKLTDYFTNVSPSTILIFTGTEVNKNNKLPKAIAKYGRIFDFDVLDKNSLLSFVDKRFREGGVSVPRSIMEYVIDKTGYYNKESDYDLFTFNNDIVKMIALTEDSELTKQVVDEAVESDMETFIFSLLNSISAGQKGKALQLMHNIVGDDSDVYPLIGMIVSHFETMLSIRELMDGGVPDRVIIEKLGIKQYRLKMLRPYIANFDAQKLKSILESAYQLDKKIKTGLLKPGLALEMFVSQI